MGDMDASNLSFRAASEADWAAIAALLAANDLPLDGAQEHLPDFWLALNPDGSLAGMAAVEPYGAAGLLRSVAVAQQNRGVGQAMMRHMLAQARAAGMTQLVLLTTTAAGYFPRFGFRPIPRAEAPEAVRASAEFRGACPDTAEVMVVEL
jgi:N-acetylglutamate synthase-like GNAT family acetyltransferase